MIQQIFAEQLPAHLYGISYVGDNIQDEWFIVSLLFHLTREILGLVVRCCDSDGEFLLIEAAEHLPEWANPEVCEQRVSIFRFIVCKLRRRQRLTTALNLSSPTSIMNHPDLSP